MPQKATALLHNQHPISPDQGYSIDYRQVLDALGGPIAILNHDGLIISANQAWHDFRWPKVFPKTLDWTGLNYLNICESNVHQGEADGGIIVEGIRAVLNQTQAKFEIVYPFHSANDQRWFKLNAYPLKAVGKICAIIKCDEVTESIQREKELQKAWNREHELLNQLEFRLRLKRLINDSQPALIAYWDKELHCVYANARYLDWFGVTGQAAIGQHMRDILGPDLFTRNLQYIQGALDGKVQRFERELVKSDGSKSMTWASYTPDISPDGDVLGFVVMVADITELRMTEQFLLEQRALVAEANARSSAKTNFLAHMSHELRTPLNAITNYTALIKEDLLALNITQSVQDLTMIETAGDHLLALISNILDLTKIETDRIELDIQDVRLNEIIEDIVTIARSLAIPNHNAFEFVFEDEFAVITVDSLRLKQCLLNLIGNAMKFTTAGTVRLVIRIEPKMIEFQVEDTGIGMAEDELSGLFKPFEQANGGKTRRVGGTGLGLYLTKTYLEMMGGTISVSSHLGRGSTFTVHLPRQIPPAG